MDTLYWVLAWMQLFVIWYFYLLPLSIPAVILACVLHQRNEKKALELNVHGPLEFRHLWRAPKHPFGDYWGTTPFRPFIFWPLTLLRQLLGPVD